MSNNVKHTFKIGECEVTMSVDAEGQVQTEWSPSTPETQQQLQAGQDAFWHQVMAAQGYAVSRNE